MVIFILHGKDRRAHFGKWNKIKGPKKPHRQFFESRTVQLLSKNNSTSSSVSSKSI